MFNPNDIKKLMKQMNMQQLPVAKVEFHLENGDVLVIKDAEVTKMDVMGQQVYQVKGDAVKAENEIPLEDVKLVAYQTGASDEEALKRLKEVKGDIALAIKLLKEAKES